MGKFFSKIKRIFKRDRRQQDDDTEEDQDPGQRSQ